MPRARANELLAREFRVELRSWDIRKGFDVLRCRFPEDEELDRVDQPHEPAHELTVAVRLHMGKVSGRVSVRLEQDETSVFR